VPLPQEFLDLAQRVRNWGRWGDDDERGTLNLIDADAIRRGAATAKTGKTFSLAMALDQQGPQIGVIPGRVNPLHTMVAINMPYGDTFHTSDDVVTMGLQACTHWDALAHASYDGNLYNGFPASAITAEQGATRCGIDKVGAIVTRGVLLDVARVKGVERIEPGYAFTAADLDAAADAAKVKVQPGDVVLLRTGHITLFQAGDKLAYSTAGGAGPSMGTVGWFHDRGVAAVATDNITFEVFPGERDAEVFFPVHLLHLVEMGMTQGQNWDLEALAADCADDGVYEFLLSASPEPFTGGTGSPVIPIAIK
jgi:kynurenine formamidase